MLNAILGGCYAFGKGVTQSFTEAVKYYKLSADQGLADAQYNLGWCYENGKGVTQSFMEAARYFKLAADQGNVQAQYCLGWCYATGKGVAKNDAEADRYDKLAAQQDSIFKSIRSSLPILFNQDRVQQPTYKDLY